MMTDLPTKAVILGNSSFDDRYCLISGPSDGMLKSAVLSQKQTYHNHASISRYKEQGQAGGGEQNEAVGIK